MSSAVVAPYPYSCANSSESHFGHLVVGLFHARTRPEVSCGVYLKPSSCMQAATISSDSAIWAAASTSSWGPPIFSMYAESGLSSHVERRVVGRSAAPAGAPS